MILIMQTLICFQYVVNDICSPYTFKFCFVYLFQDDIKIALILTSMPYVFSVRTEFQSNTNSPNM